MRVFGAYRSYKCSGIDWLGAVPRHWNICRLKNAATIIAGQAPLSENVSENLDGLPFLQGNAEFGRMHPSPRLACEDPAKTAKAGDILLSVRAPVGAVNIADRDYGIGRGLCAVRARPGVDRIFASCALDVAKTELLRLSTGSTYDAVTVGIVSGLSLPFPPLAEQRTIVRYLDYVDRRVRRYVRAKERLIGLLEEEKQAIINQAVTRGLDPSVRMKASGVEWLGDVPEHWEVRRIGQFSKVGNGSTPSRQNPAYWSDRTYPWLTSSSVNQDTITKADQFVTESALLECHLPKVQPDSVLIGITGQGKTRGMSALLAVEATINQHMAYITPRDIDAVVSSHYLHMYLTAAYRELRALSESSGSTKAALTCEDVKHFQVALPPRREQDRLVADVRKEVAINDGAIARARRQIELLEEYRTRLIADVVTGKLDVREAAAGLAEDGDDDLGGADGLGSGKAVGAGIATGRGRLETGPYAGGVRVAAGWLLWLGVWFDTPPSAGSGQALRKTSGRLTTNGWAPRPEEAGWKPGPVVCRWWYFYTPACSVPRLRKRKHLG